MLRTSEATVGVFAVGAIPLSADRTDHELNRLIREHEATAVIHTGDFGFLNADSLERMGDKWVEVRCDADETGSCGTCCSIRR